MMEFLGIAGIPGGINILAGLPSSLHIYICNLLEVGDVHICLINMPTPTMDKQQEFIIVIPPLPCSIALIISFIMDYIVDVFINFSINIMGSMLLEVISTLTITIAVIGYYFAAVSYSPRHIIVGILPYHSLHHFQSKILVLYIQTGMSAEYTT